ncbi:hypothetical protein [Labedaea rhizosphaerae]|uniref:Uncharacterized protein n=1 Tax=Labedaea rhizosphaerae TaxID=598644 RepID=A0A4R6SBB2_LABRH|nr:hypothetical protein [Labedaea rhizosphaerae]TDP97211.1 hypothetical protein EV186_103173 [Labedaea rhizosphaerae]
MLYLVLGLVLAAFGLLIAGLTTANTLWAWLSVVLSIAAAGVLVYDWLRNRREAEDTTAAEPAQPDHLEADRSEPATPVTTAGSEPTPPTPPAVPPPVDDDPAPPTELVDAVVDPDDEPPEEATDATDLLVVSGLFAEVRVIDERPRYHLAKCTWVGARPTLGLPVSEARQLGFTPCALCGPDAVLARRHREGSGARRT